jgi:glutathione S-transferase
MNDQPPVLWHYTFSNYNEKARWALDFKRIPHRRRSLLPGSPRALRFSAGDGTLPAVDMDGERIVDSTRIIEALDRRFAERPLYPADDRARSRALELEDYFDEHAGHDVRRVAFWDLRDEPGYLAAFTATGFGGMARTWMRASGSIAWAYASRRYGFNEADVDRSRRQVVVALDRLVEELGGGDHLVGDDFTVADLTAASLLYPLAWPDELQYSPPAPPRWEFGESLADHPSVGWIRETYRRYRGVSAEA